jgi:transcriptional regulator with XRE-family HTH domain
MSHTQVLTDQVVKCAEMDMSQAEIADLLRVSPTTVARITSQLNITLKRKKREYGPNNAIYKTARESELNPAVGTEDSDAASVAAEAARAKRADREAKVRDQRSAEARLKASLEGVTDKHVRYEITYGHCLLEFEKLQHKLGNRDPLPSREARKSTMHPSAVELAERRRQHGIEQGERLFRMLRYDQRISASEGAGMLGDSIARTSSYLNNMAEAGKLYRVRDFIKVPGYTKPQWRWVFSKQPIKPLSNKFEGGE